MKMGVMVLAVAGFAACVQADVIISNLSSTDTSQSASLQGGRIKAMGFQMGNETFQLDNVVLRLDVSDASVEPLIRVYDDSGNNPGSLIATLDNPTIAGGGIADYTFTSGGGVTLDAGAVYWVVVYNVGGGDLDWRTSSTPPSGQFATHVGGRFSTDTGPNPPTTNSTLINVYEVNGSTGDCACLANLAGDCETNTNDFFAFLALYQAGDLAADFSPDGMINTNDFFAYLAAYQNDLNNPDCPG